MWEIQMKKQTGSIMLKENKKGNPSVAWKIKSILDQTFANCTLRNSLGNDSVL